MANQDISRWLLQTRKHYTAARLQQGRILLDSDPNEGSNLADEQRRRTLVEVFGPSGSRDDGFQIRSPVELNPDNPPLIFADQDSIDALTTTFNGGDPEDVLALSFMNGSIYLGGLRFDADQAENVFFQRDFLQALPSSDATALLPLFQANFRYLYYLRAWEQAVSAVEDQEVAEAMLRGADTSFRIRRMRRVEVFPTTATTCNEAWSQLVAQRLELANADLDPRTHELQSRGKLRLVFSGGESADTCSPSDPFGKRYLGAENQALRVQLTSDSTYVWALDNAAPLFKVKVSGLIDPSVNGVVVTILNPPTEERHMPFQERVVEIVPFSALLEGGDLLRGADPHFRKVADELGVFTRVGGPYDPVKHSFKLELPGNTLSNLRNLVSQWDPDHHPFASQLNAVTDEDDTRFFYMRLWHHAPTVDTIQIPTSDGAPLGDTGIVPVFVHDGQAGDHWVATLRVDLPKLVQPFDLLTEDGASPVGPRRFFAPLALVAGKTNENPQATTITQALDCRPRIRPLADRGCTKLIVGDGIHSFGDFTSIQDAINALPLEGGVVSVRPGVYDGPFTIQRDGVTLEGCGDATVLQSTPGQSTSIGVLSIIHANRVRLRGFRLQAFHERALFLEQANDVDIGGLHILTGELDGGAFFPFGVAGFSQVEISGDCADVRLHDSLLEPVRQPCVRVGSSQNVALTGLQILPSVQALERNDFAPLVEIDGGDVHDVTVSDSVLEARGQFGVHVADTAQNVLLEGLTITVHAHETEDQLIVHARPAINIDDGRDVTIRRCRIAVDDTQTEHAAVVLYGVGITLEESFIEALAIGGVSSHAWGGVQVRSSSQTVQIRKNRIQGGYGHGITLGSVVWFHREDTFSEQFLGAGAGTGQTELGTNNRVTGRVKDVLQDSQVVPNTQLLFQAEPESTGISLVISDLVIADNRIEGMSTNGISALTVLGFFEDFDLVEVDGARIERNVITGNLVHPFFNVRTLTPLAIAASDPPSNIHIPRIPFGGIVLATATDIQIRDNQIVGNATTNTGTLPINGIFVLNGDTIDIEGNRILDNGTRAPSDTRIPVRSGPRAGIAVMLAGTGGADSLADLGGFLDEPSTLDNGDVSLRVTNNTVRQIEGRALLAIATGPVHIQGNYLSSRGNAGGDVSNEQLQVGDLIYVQNLGGPWERIDLAESGIDIHNVYETPPQRVIETLLALQPTSPYFYRGDGGAILFNNNHTTLDWDVQRAPTQPQVPLAKFPIAFVTLDHLGMMGNHMALRIANAPSGRPPLPSDPEIPAGVPVLSHVVAIALTIGIQLNRFSEGVGSTFLSLMSRAEIMSSTVLNQATHDMFSIRQVRSNDFLDTSDNQILFRPTPAHQDLEQLRNALLSLFNLTFAF